MIENLNDTYHIVMISVGVFGAVASIISIAWAIYSGNRKHKLMVKQYEDKQRYFKRLAKEEKRLAIAKKKNVKKRK
jgi:hypothetical protein